MSIIFKILSYLKKNINQVKSIISIICIATTVISICVAVIANSQVREQDNLINELNISKQQLINKNKELNDSIQEYTNQITEKDTTIENLNKQVKELNDKVNNLSSNKSSSTTFKADGNYNQATQVWNYLRNNLGLNEYVSAGIIGNIMAEVGGQTLDISRWPIYSKNYYYGICQWAGNRKQRLLNDFGTTLEAQITFLGVELFEVIPKDNSFYSMQNEKETALYFAKYYERCSSKYYSIRQSNATKALEYFRGIS